jgi:CIC family chloride channel protein
LIFNAYAQTVHRDIIFSDNVRREIIMGNFSLVRNSAILAVYASTLFGAVIGVLVSVAAATFVEIVEFFTILREQSELTHFEIGLFSFNPIVAVMITVSAILILIIRSTFQIGRWHGPADTMYVAHQEVEPLDIKIGVASTLAALASACGGASVGQYGPLVHFGATVSSLLKRLLSVQVKGNVVIGAGVAAAISAGFDAPIAGIIFAHEAIIRHFSPKAMAPIATSAIVAAAMVNYVFVLPDPLVLHGEPPALVAALLPVIFSAVFFGFIAVVFMTCLRSSTQLNQKLKLPAHQSIIIAILSVIFIGALVPSSLGLGTSTLTELLSIPHSLGFVLALIAAKIILTSACLGFGFFGGVFSPALLVGAASGVAVSRIFDASMSSGLTSALTLAGMASVAACVVGAPLATVFIVLELTLSYEFTLITLLAVVVSQVVSENLFGHSFFDRQLIDRGIDLRFGRSQLGLTLTNITECSTSDFLQVSESTSVSSVIATMRSEAKTEAYCTDENGAFAGKTNINLLLSEDPSATVSLALESAPLVLSAESSLNEAMEKAATFVGESIPVVDLETKQMTGVVTEADLFAAYLEVQEEVRLVEK